MKSSSPVAQAAHTQAQPPAGLSHLKFRHLMLIQHLAAHGALHQAARYLNISQPAATAMLSSLEALIGFKLFKRSHRGVVASAQAQSVIDRTATLLHEFNDFAATLEHLGQGRQRVMRIGAVPQAFATFLPQAMRHFRERGGCAVRIEEATARQLLAMLSSGRLDCALSRLTPDQGLEGSAPVALDFVRLYEEAVCVVAGKLAAVPAQGPVSLHALASADWVLQRTDSSVRIALSEAFLRLGLRPPEPVIETSTYNQSLALISDSAMLTAAPRRAAALREALGAVKIVPMTEPIALMQVGFVHRRSSRDDAAVGLFRDCLLQAVHESQDT